MTELVRNLPSVLVSLALHGVIVLILLMIPVVVPTLMPEVILESIFTEELAQEDLTREVDIETTPSETLNVLADGSLSDHH